MPQTVTQSLTLPSNVTAGGTVQASDVATLYNTLNALVIPDAVAAAFVNVYSTASAITIAGTTSTSDAAQDISLSQAVPANKPILALGAYSWATTGITGSGSLIFRWNASSTGSTSGQIAVGGGIPATSTSGNGMYFLLIAPRDAANNAAVLAFITGSTSNVVTFTGSTSLPISTGNSTSFGLGVRFGTATAGSTASSISWNYAEIWRKQ